jgi:hypothetical protein
MSVLPADLRASTTFDLHLHTSASDGRYPLDDVLSRCAGRGLDVVAITDHDLSLDLAPGAHTIDGHRLHVLPGAEISGVHEGREYHLLVYFPTGVPAAFRDFCRRQCDERQTRYAAAVASLGFDLPPPTDARALTRLHLAHALVDAGAVTSRGEAFKTYLGDGHGHVPHLQLPFAEAIRTARRCGGITSWAHPPLDAVRRYLPEFVAAGLQGVELYRPRITSSDRKALKKLARRHGLIVTGGSDWHGWNGDQPGLFRVQSGQLGGFLELLRAA